MEIVYRQDSVKYTLVLYLREEMKIISRKVVKTMTREALPQVNLRRSQALGESRVTHSSPLFF